MEKVRQTSQYICLLTNSLYSQGYLNDQHERLTSESLFGGLVHGKITSLDIRLDIPELPDDIDNCSR